MNEGVFRELWKKEAARIKEDILTQGVFYVEKNTPLLPQELKEKYRKREKGSRGKLVAFLSCGVLPREVDSAAIGRVFISNASIKDTLEHSYGYMKLDTLACIDKLLADAVKISEEKIIKGREEVTSHILTRKVKWGDEDFIIVMAVNEDRQGKRLYDHEMKEIEKLNELSPAGVGLKGGRTGNHGGTHRALIGILSQDIWLGKYSERNMYIARLCERNAAKEAPQKLQGKFRKANTENGIYNGAIVNVSNNGEITQRLGNVGNSFVVHELKNVKGDFLKEVKEGRSVAFVYRNGKASVRSREENELENER